MSVETCEGMVRAADTVNLTPIIRIAENVRQNILRYLDIGAKFLDAQGAVPKDIMPDGLHPNEKGYQIWAEAMNPLLTEMMK